MDLSLTRTSETATADRPWLASRHGLDAPISITIDVPLLSAGVHYGPSPTLPGRSLMFSGIPLARVSGSGLYGR
ncbi:hypothetical protein [Streptomyces hainanensis]|uniref:Uncharacterized protein n=1 Tax=Streptomyces hainanensis TaxID=402648 RepID=A0A4R4TID3_9ACTN|nr:hypothetical protein [Streptomyces hainanensis]TDC77511.1 hypothetical protein E1283_07175 [Streptomyces hainanensis]